MRFSSTKNLIPIIGALAFSALAAACGGAAPTTPAGSTSPGGPSGGKQTSGPKPTFYFSGIPDQDTSRWAQRYDTVAKYLSEQLGVEVRGVPSVDYSAVVTGFEKGSIHLAWFGGFTGVQAQVAVPETIAFAQRPVDEQFHSVFIAQSNLSVKEIKDLKGLTFTFGSESSTSGHLMPRYYMLEAGVNPDKDLKGKPNFSSSHDTTWKVVESGAFQTGVLSEEVWDRAVQEKTVVLTKVKEVSRTPAYYDYHWRIRGDVDKTYGAGFTRKVQDAILEIKDPQILELFATDKFIATKNENYTNLLDVAKQAGLIR